jgi:hypothetical protein
LTLFCTCSTERRIRLLEAQKQLGCKPASCNHPVPSYQYHWHDAKHQEATSLVYQSNGLKASSFAESLFFFGSLQKAFGFSVEGAGDKIIDQGVAGVVEVSEGMWTMIKSSVRSIGSVRSQKVRLSNPRAVELGNVSDAIFLASLF